MRISNPLFLLLAAFFFLVGPVSVYATVDEFPGQVTTPTPTQTNGGNSGTPTQTNGGNTGTSLVNPLANGGTLQGLITSILNFVVQIGAIVVVLMLVFVGFKFVTARGVPGEIENAKKMLLWTIIGALVLLGAKAISAGIQSTVSALGG